MIDKKFLDIPYKLNGRDFNGIDCIGIMELYFREKGTTIPDNDGIVVDEKTPDEEKLIRYTEGIKNLIPEYGDFILNFKMIKPDDILCFSIDQKYIHQAVIYIDNGYFLEIRENEVSKLTQLNEIYKRLFSFAVRVKKCHQ